MPKRNSSKNLEEFSKSSRSRIKRLLKNPPTFSSKMKLAAVPNMLNPQEGLYLSTKQDATGTAIPGPSDTYYQHRSEIFDVRGGDSRIDDSSNEDCPSDVNILHDNQNTEFNDNYDDENSNTNIVDDLKNCHDDTDDRDDDEGLPDDHALNDVNEYQADVGNQEINDVDEHHNDYADEAFDDHGTNDDDDEALDDYEINDVDELDNDNDEAHVDDHEFNNVNNDELDNVEEYDDAEEEEDDDDDDNADDEERNNDIHDLNDAAEGNHNVHPDDADFDLYNGSEITVGESMLAILTYVLKHNVSGVALSDMLKLINLLLPTDSLFKKTKYTFWKHFERQKSPLVKHFYCSTCFSALNDERDACLCNANERPETTYFIEIPISCQLQDLFNKPQFVSNLQKTHEDKIRPNREYIEDIYDGELYKYCIDKLGLLNNENHLSFMWYSDGAPAFKSRKMSIWPIYLIINELPYKERIKKENIIVAGLWCSPIDPVANLFLQPLLDQMNVLLSGKLFQVPSLNQERLVKAILICGTADAPATSDFMNHIRFNGAFGCWKCKLKGETIRGEDFGNTHVYPFTNVTLPRTHAEHQQHATQAHQTGQPVFGVKGPSLLYNLMPDVIKGLTIDIMHCIYLGIIKRLAFLWLDPSLRFCDFNISEKIAIVDDRLINIKPPSYVGRLPRTFSQHSSYFKASEWKHWFHFYSLPIFRDLFKEKYFNHYLKLYLALSILNNNTISQPELELANQYLKSFVAEFEGLYGKRYMSFNLHCLLHLVEVVRDTGPLWVTSCFPYEDLNGQLLKGIHGSSQINLQIYSRIAHSAILNHSIDELDDDSDVKKFCKLLIMRGKRLPASAVRIHNGIYTLGKIITMLQTPDRIQRALRNENINIANSKIAKFHRLKKDNYVIESMTYTRKLKTTSFCVDYYDAEDEVTRFGFVQNFLKICECRNVCDENCDATFFALVTQKAVKRPFRAKNYDPGSDEIIQENTILNVYQITPTYHEGKLVSVRNLNSLCGVIEVGDITYIIEPANNKDAE